MNEQKTRMLKCTIHIYYDLWDKDGNYLWDDKFENYIFSHPGWWASGANASGRIIRDHAVDLPRIGFRKHLAEIKSKLPKGSWISIGSTLLFEHVV